MYSRVRRVVVDGWAQPEAMRRFMYGTADQQVWLDAGSTGDRSELSRRSYIGMTRTRIVTASVENGTVTERYVHNGLERIINASIFDYLRDDLLSNTPRLVGSDAADGLGFQLGWVGWFGYELGALTTGAPGAMNAIGEEVAPDACFMFLDRAVEFDHASRTVFALSFEGDDEWARDVAIAISASAKSTPTQFEFERPISSSWRHDQSHYEALIQNCLDEIRAGNAYQLCLTNRIDVAFETAPNPFDVYERLRVANPSHHGGLIVAGGVSLISSSPEVFLSVSSDGHATTKPIKGTRPRSTDVEVDAAMADELRTNEKERAENLMIVDLMRNDLGRVCEVGSVIVEKLFDVESYASVHQLVSTVGGNLAEGVSAVDALAACFPAGSMTGAPKLSAMRILNGLEAGPRGVYSGAFGYLSLDGACDFAMVIRSIVLNGTRGYIGTGGGITSGSMPREEWEETLLKARPLLTALGGDLAGTAFDLVPAN
jgi:aminodeoxychorismate synthase component I